MAQSLSNLAVGAKIKFGKYSVNGETAQDLVWIIVAKAHSCTPAYPTNSITLLTEKIIDMRCFDAIEPNNSNSDRKSYGNNRYSLSNIDQWLNKDSAGGSWYSAQHSADQSPNSSTYVTEGTPYATRPGFLNAFTTEEKNAILSTTIRVAKPIADGAGYEDISRKIFLPSTTEVGLANENSIAEGAIWSYFSGGNRNASLTFQAFTHSPSTSKPSTHESAWYWWLRTPYYSVSPIVRNVVYDGTLNSMRASYGANGVRPAVNLLSTLSVSDTTDNDGCYTMVWNSAPSAPINLNVPIIYGGKSNTISWSSVSDPDGDSVSYELECAYNGGSFSKIYSGTALTYNHTVIYGETSIQYRVRAVDSNGAYSAYTTSSSVSVINNQAPVISGSDSNLGTKTEGFSQTYTVTDVDTDGITVTEAIDGVQVRSYTVTLGNTNTFAVTGTTWLKLTNGTHSMTITALDLDGTKSVRTYTFTKNVTSFSVQTAPMEASIMPTRISVSVTKDIPAEAIFTVEACNNGNDDEPTWEDMTASVTGVLVHVFANTSKTADSWAVMIRVTVDRNDGEGACYISAIGGSFE